MIDPPAPHWKSLPIPHNCLFCLYVLWNTFMFQPKEPLRSTKHRPLVTCSEAKCEGEKHCEGLCPMRACAQCMQAAHMVKTACLARQHFERYILQTCMHARGSICMRQTDVDDCCDSHHCKHFFSALSTSESECSMGENNA
jgi:hypothetical protein